MMDSNSEAAQRGLSQALGALVRAADKAEHMRDQSLCDDIWQIASEIARLIESLA